MNKAVETGQAPAVAAPHALVRHVLAGGLAGLVSGLFFLGLGSRVAMRISATLDPDMKGAFTENGNVVGEVTLAGTLELAFFGGLFGGLMAGGVWVIVREWLPGRPALRVPLAGVTAAVLGSFLIVSSENEDFMLLEPAWGNIAMFIALVGLTGTGAALLEGHIERRLGNGRTTFLLSALLLMAGGVMVTALLVQAFLSEEVCGCEDPPRLALPFLGVVAGATAVSWAGRLWSFAEPSWLRPVAAVALVIACVIAAADLADEVQAIA